MGEMLRYALHNQFFPIRDPDYTNVRPRRGPGAPYKSRCYNEKGKSYTRA